MNSNLNANRLSRLARPVGPKTRHLGVLALAVLFVYLFLLSRAEWSDMHRWNRAFGDASLVLIALAMVIGPTVRFFRGARILIPWRRELGIWGVLLALVHTVIILFGWVQWDFMRLFGFELHPALERYVMFSQGFGFANVIGIIALLYGAALAMTSNNVSQRLLGGTVWKFLQQSSYVLWALIVLHTFYFLFLHFLDFHRSIPEPNWFQWPFVGVVVAILAFQSAAFWVTWRANRRDKGGRRGLRDRVVAEDHDPGVEGVST